MMKLIFAAGIVSITVISTASAFPLTPATPAAGAGSSNLIEVKSYKSYKSYKPYKANKPYKKNWYGKKKYAYHPGWKYRHAPKDWHRYSYRPLGWQMRGCIMVGPLWFCP